MMLRYIEEHPNICVDGIVRKKGKIGYCWCKTHRGYLTEKILKDHECLQKNCRYLEKFPNEAFWQRRIKTKLARNNKKVKREESEFLARKAVMIAKEFTCDIDNFKITQAEVLENGTVKINFVAIYFVNLEGVVNLMRKILGRNIWMNSLKRSISAKKKMLGIDELDPDRDEQMEYLNEKSYDNQPDVVTSQVCGCFACRLIFQSDDVTDYINDTFGTAVCPYCGSNSVLPESDEYELSEDLLESMNQYWFDGKVSEFV